MRLHLLLSAFLLVTGPALAQAPAPGRGWPRNAQTGEIEFQGVLAWPPRAKTERQRQKLVRKWYTRKLTDDPPKQVLKEGDEETAEILLTYGHLLKDVVIQYGKSPRCSLLGYSVYLTPLPQGLQYSLKEFTLNTCSGIGAKTPDMPLEHVLAQDSAANAAALGFFRARFSKVAVW